MNILKSYKMLIKLREAYIVEFQPQDLKFIFHLVKNSLTKNL